LRRMRLCVGLMLRWASRVQAAAGARRVEGFRRSRSRRLRAGLIEGVVAGRRVLPLTPLIPWCGWVDREQFGVWRGPGRTDRGRMLWDPQVSQDGADDAGGGEEGEDAHLPVAGRAPEGMHLVDAGEELRTVCVPIRTLPSGTQVTEIQP